MKRKERQTARDGGKAQMKSRREGKGSEGKLSVFGGSDRKCFVFCCGAVRLIEDALNFSEKKRTDGVENEW